MPISREYKRFASAGKAVLRFQNGRQYCLPASLVDIGAGGFRVQSSYPLEVNKKVAFSLTPKSATAALAGHGTVRHLRVARSRGVTLCTVGIQFGDTRPAGIRQLLSQTAGVRQHSLFSKQQRRDFTLIARIAPVIVLTTWFFLHTFCVADMYTRKQKEQDERFNDALVSYLYRAD